MQKANTLYRLFGLLAAALLAVCFLPLSALAAGPVTFNIEYLDEDQYVVGNQEGVTAETDKDDLVNMAALDYKLPSGFEMGVNSDKFFVENRETVSVHLKHIRVNFTLEYLDEDDRVVATQTGMNAPVDKDLLVDMTKLPYELPAGYEMAGNSDKFFIENGDTVSVHIRHIYVNFNLQYRDADNRTLGSQKGVAAPIDAEGKVDLSALDLRLPAGCTLAETPGKLAVKDGDTVVIRVKTPPVPKTVTVNYWDVENKTAAGTGRITVDQDAAQADTALLTDVPAGYELVTRGTAPIVDGLLYVEVKPVPVSDGRVVMNILFKDGETTVRGGDFRVPAGVQKYAVLSEFVPQGYILTQSGDFTAAANTKLTVSVRKYPAEVAVNVRFMDGDKVVADGKYPLTEGVQKYSALARYLPAGQARKPCPHRKPPRGKRFARFPRGGLFLLKSWPGSVQEFPGGGVFADAHALALHRGQHPADVPGQVVVVLDLQDHRAPGMDPHHGDGRIKKGRALGGADMLVQGDAHPLHRHGPGGALIVHQHHRAPGFLHQQVARPPGSLIRPGPQQVPLPGDQGLGLGPGQGDAGLVGVDPLLLLQFQAGGGRVGAVDAQADLAPVADPQHLVGVVVVKGGVKVQAADVVGPGGGIPVPVQHPVQQAPDQGGLPGVEQELFLVPVHGQGGGVGQVLHASSASCRYWSR